MPCPARVLSATASTQPKKENSDLSLDQSVAGMSGSQGKARQGKASQGKSRQGKARQVKARQGKASQGK
eukprot:jgi/Psemu1/47187/gm1.47187_g